MVPERRNDEDQQDHLSLPGTTHCEVAERTVGRPVDDQPGHADPTRQRRRTRTQRHEEPPEGDDGECRNEWRNPEVTDLGCGPRQPCTHRPEKGLEGRLGPGRTLCRQYVVAEDGVTRRELASVLLDPRRPVHEVDVVPIRTDHDEAEHRRQEREHQNGDGDTFRP